MPHVFLPCLAQHSGSVSCELGGFRVCLIPCTLPVTEMGYIEGENFSLPANKQLLVDRTVFLSGWPEVGSQC